MALEELKIISKFSVKKWSNKKEDAVGRFLKNLVERRDDPIFKQNERTDAEVAALECCPVLLEAIASFTSSFEVDHRCEAQYWRSGVQLLIDDFPSCGTVHKALEQDLLDSVEIQELEDKIEYSEDCEAWGSGSGRPPTNMPAHHTWLRLTSRISQSDEELASIEECSSPVPDLRDEEERCRYFPQCAKFGCDKAHPVANCRSFPDCRGRFCHFLHGYCKSDGRCEDAICLYEHNKQPSPCVHEEQMTKRIVKKEAACVATSSNKKTHLPKGFHLINREGDAVRDQTIPVSAPANTGPQPRRCKFFPQCSRKSCPFSHPSIMCRKWLSGKGKCPGKFCLYLHRACPDDGVCVNVECAHEHYESVPALLRSHLAKKRGSLHSSGYDSSLGSLSSVFSDGSDRSPLASSSSQWLRLHSSED